MAFTSEPCSERGEKKNRVRLPFGFGFGMVRRISKKGFLKKMEEKNEWVLDLALGLRPEPDSPLRGRAGGGRGYNRGDGGGTRRVCRRWNGESADRKTHPGREIGGQPRRTPATMGFEQTGLGWKSLTDIGGERTTIAPPPFLIAPTNSPFGSPGFPGRGSIRGVLDRLVENPRGKKLI